MSINRTSYRKLLNEINPKSKSQDIPGICYSYITQYLHVVSPVLLETIVTQKKIYLCVAVLPHCQPCHIKYIFFLLVVIDLYTKSNSHRADCIFVLFIWSDFPELTALLEFAAIFFFQLVGIALSQKVEVIICLIELSIIYTSEYNPGSTLKKLEKIFVLNINTRTMTLQNQVQLFWKWYQVTVCCKRSPSEPNCSQS